MFVKRYIAPNMAEAMEKIRKELGPEAVILNSRHVRPQGFFGFFKKKLLEVVVAYELESTKPARGKKGKEQPAPDAEPAKPEKSEEEKAREEKAAAEAEASTKILSKLNEKLDELQSTIKSFGDRLKNVEKDAPASLSPAIADIYVKLIERDVSAELARKLAQEAQGATSRMDESPRSIMEQLILEKLGDTANIKLKKFKPNVIFLIGPTGAGKTTTLVKLAGKYTVEQGLKVGLINTDTYRVAAQEQLRTYADIMGTPMYTCYSPDEMNEALKTLSDRDVILVDTAGKSSHDEAYHKEIETYLQLSNPDEVLLTISLVTGHLACKEILRNYSFVQDYKLIITKVDEVCAWGNILNIVTAAGKPLSYLTVGQSVPDDIEIADMKKIADNILESV